MCTPSVSLKDALGSPKYTITQRKMLNMTTNSCQGPGSSVEKETEASKRASTKKKASRAVACVAWRFWLGALSNKGGRGDWGGSKKRRAYLCREFCHSWEHNNITSSTIESVFWQESPSKTSSCPWLPIRILLRKGLKSNNTSLRRDPEDLNPISNFSDKLNRLKSTEPFSKLGMLGSSSQENTSSSTSAEALRWPPQLAARDRLSTSWTSLSDAGGPEMKCHCVVIIELKQKRPATGAKTSLN